MGLFELSLVSLGGDTVQSVWAEPGDSIAQVKRRLEAAGSAPPAAQQRLVLGGVVLDDDATLAECGLSHEAEPQLTLVTLSAFDAFSAAELNTADAGMLGNWRGFWRSPGSLRVSGAEVVGCNGTFHPTGIHEKRPLYQGPGGAVIHFAGGWKLSNTGDTSTWCLSAPGAGAWPVPPATGWVAGTAPRAAPAPAVRVIEQAPAGFDDEAECWQEAVDFEGLLEDNDALWTELDRIGFDGLIWDRFRFVLPSALLADTVAGNLEVELSEGQEEAVGSWEKAGGTLRVSYRVIYAEFGANEYELQLVKGEHWAYLAGAYCENDRLAGVLFLNPPPPKVPLARALVQRLPTLGTAPPELRIPRQRAPPKEW